MNLKRIIMAAVITGIILVMYWALLGELLRPLGSVLSGGLPMLGFLNFQSTIDWFFYILILPMTFVSLAAPSGGKILMLRIGVFAFCASYLFLFPRIFPGIQWFNWLMWVFIISALIILITMIKGMSE